MQINYLQRLTRKLRLAPTITIAINGLIASLITSFRQANLAHPGCQRI